MKFTLPLPPSINQTYGVSRTGDHAMYKRRPVKDWENDAGYAIIEQKKGQTFPFPGSVSVAITWYYKIDRDIDAGIKVLLDLLERQGIVLNDRQIRRITNIDIYPDWKNPRVEIEIHAMD